MSSLDLAPSVVRLIDDLGGLSAVAVLGLADGNDDAVAALARDRRWVFADVRGAAPVGSLDAPVLVLAASVKRPLPPLVMQRLREVIDKRAPTKQKIIVVCEGATQQDQLPSELARVPYSLFLRG